MAVKLKKSTIIGDVLDIAPQTAPLFMAIGMHCLAARRPAARPWKRPAWYTALTPMRSWRRSTDSSRPARRKQVSEKKQRRLRPPLVIRTEMEYI